MHEHLTGFGSQLTAFGADGNPVKINSAAKADISLSGVPPQGVGYTPHGRNVGLE